MDVMVVGSSISEEPVSYVESVDVPLTLADKMGDEERTFRVRSTRGNDALAKEFVGRRLGCVSTERPDSPRWTELHAFRASKSGKIIYASLGRSRAKNQRTFCDVKVFRNLEEMCARLGCTRLTQDLYKSMGLSDVIPDIHPAEAGVGASVWRWRAGGATGGRRSVSAPRSRSPIAVSFAA